MLINASLVLRLIAAIAASAAASAAAQPPADLGDLLARVARSVEQYYSRAQSIICLETVRLQTLGVDLNPNGPARVLQYELRVSWEPTTDGTPPEASVLRRVLKVDGRPPKPDAEPGCMDPHAVSPEPLAMMLPPRREEYTFTWGGLARVGNRRATVLRYRSRTAGPADVTWRGDCVSFSLPGRAQGRVWIDNQTDQVLRLDESLVGRFSYDLPREHSRAFGPSSFEIERAESSIRYRPVVFHDPDETILLPSQIDSMQIIRGSGAPRLRTTQLFSGYQRFVTDAHIVVK